MSPQQSKSARPNTRFDRHVKSIEKWAVEVVTEDSDSEVTSAQVELAQLTIDLIARYKAYDDKEGLKFSKVLAEFIAGVLESRDTRAIEEVLDWICWLDKQTDEDETDSPFEISVISILTLMTKIHDKRGSRSRLPPNFKGIDASINDNSNSQSIEVNSGGEFNRDRGAQIFGVLPETNGVPLLANVEENSSRAKLTISGKYGERMGAKMGSEVPRFLKRGNHGDSTDEEYGEAKSSISD